MRRWHVAADVAVVIDIEDVEAARRGGFDVYALPAVEGEPHAGGSRANSRIDPAYQIVPVEIGECGPRGAADKRGC